MTLVLPAVLSRRMRAHLEIGYPREACGILIGETVLPTAGPRHHPSDQPPTKIVIHAVLTPNAWPEGSEDENLLNRFAISPDDVVRADRQARLTGLDIVGFFHSHPDQPAQPSRTDHDFAWPMASCVIVRVAQGRAMEARSWVWREGGPGFEEEQILELPLL